MNLMADEGLERQVVERLRSDGHTVRWVAEFAPGLTDDEVLSHALSDGTLLITEDKDFGELVYRRRLSDAGVALVRLDGITNAAKAELVSQTIRNYGPEMIGAFSVVTPDAVRMRRPSG